MRLCVLVMAAVAAAMAVGAPDVQQQQQQQKQHILAAQTADNGAQAVTTKLRGKDFILGEGEACNESPLHWCDDGLYCCKNGEVTTAAGHGSTFKSTYTTICCGRGYTKGRPKCDSSDNRHCMRATW